MKQKPLNDSLPNSPRPNFAAADGAHSYQRMRVVIGGIFALIGVGIAVHGIATRGFSKDAVPDVIVGSALVIMFFARLLVARKTLMRP